MVQIKEIVHESDTSPVKKHFSTRQIEAHPFQEAGIKQGGYSILDDKFYVRRPNNKGFHVFVFNISGLGLITMDDGTEIELKPGECFISWANGQGQFERPAPGNLVEMVWFSMWGDNARFYPSSDDYDIIEYSQSEKLKSLALSLFEEELEEDSITPQATELYEELFLLQVKRSLGWTDRGPVSRNHIILTKLWEQVSLSLNKTWSVTELSEASGLSRTHLNRLCLEIYNQSPGEKVRDLKMRQAKILLRNSDEAIGLIADELGYTSISIFSHAFRDYYGISPRDCRNGKKADN